jgi:uncharacterized protein (DUF2141 family)
LAIGERKEDFIDLYYMNTILTLYLFLELCQVGLPLKKQLQGEVSYLQNDDGIELIISNIRSQEGLIRIGLFDSETGYPDKPLVSYSLAKDTLQSGQLRLFIPLKQSRAIGLSILDDENGNGKMDYVFNIKPKEGFGFSNNPPIKGRKAPPFDQTSFSFPGGKVLINVSMVYF